MAANFPSSPTNNQLFVLDGITYQYNSTADLWNLVRTYSSTDAPSDGKDYIRNNNGWKTLGRMDTIAPTSLASTSVTVPSWARRVRMQGKLHAPNTTAQAMLLKLQFGSTILQTAGDYYLAGRVHNCSTNGMTPYYNDTSVGGILLTNGTTSTAVSLHFDYYLDVARSSTSINFMISGQAMMFGSSEPLIADYYTWVVPGKTSALRVDNIIFYNHGNQVWADGSTIDLEWLS